MIVIQMSFSVAVRHIVCMKTQTERSKSGSRFKLLCSLVRQIGLTWQHWNTNGPTLWDCDNVLSDRRTVRWSQRLSKTTNRARSASQSICHHFPNRKRNIIKLINSICLHSHTCSNGCSKNSPLIALPRFDIKCSQNDQANCIPSFGFVLRYSSSMITKLLAVTFFRMCSVIFTSSTNDDAFFSIESFEPIRVKIRSVTRSLALFAGT